MAGRPGYIHGVLGLPDHITTCLFDLDGVLTDTARVHDAAWTETFDAFLQSWAARTGTSYVPFDPASDYNSYVDGRPRADGVRTFLASRGITLPEGTPDDPPEAETVNGLGNRKNVILLRRIRTDGVRGLSGFGGLPDAPPARPGCTGWWCRPAPTATTCWSRPG